MSKLLVDTQGRICGSRLGIPSESRPTHRQVCASQGTRAGQCSCDPPPAQETNGRTRGDAPYGVVTALRERVEVLVHADCSAWRRADNCVAQLGGVAIQRIVHPAASDGCSSRRILAIFVGDDSWHAGRQDLLNSSRSILQPKRGLCCMRYTHVCSDLDDQSYLLHRLCLHQMWTPSYVTTATSRAA